MFRTVDHQADIAVEIEADNRKGLFMEAVTALISLLMTISDINGSGDEILHLKASGYDDEELLVGLLSELLFQSQTLRWGPKSVLSVGFPDSQSVEAQIVAQTNRGGEHLAREIKAVTYHGMKIENGDRWRVKIVFDV
jgi:SHS2 domain-containing protein